MSLVWQAWPLADFALALDWPRMTVTLSPSSPLAVENIINNNKVVIVVVVVVVYVVVIVNAVINSNNIVIIIVTPSSCV